MSEASGTSAAVVVNNMIGNKSAMGAHRSSLLYLMPWLVLGLSLMVTAALVANRSDAITSAEIQIMSAAQEHFDDVVAEHEYRMSTVFDAYERVLIAMLLGITSPIPPADVKQRATDLAAHELPGLKAMLVVPAELQPTIVIGSMPVDLRRVMPMTSTGLWSTPVDPEQEWVAVGYATSAGNSIAVIATMDELLAVAGNHASHSGHGVTTRLVLLEPTETTPLVFGHRHEDHDNNMPDDLHDHHIANDHAHHSSDKSPVFEARRRLTLFDSLWSLEIVAGDDFIVIPDSKEVPILSALGIALSLALFWVIHFLVSRVASESRLRTAEQRFSAGFYASPVGCAILDRDGLILEVNSALEHLLKLTKQELTSTKMEALVAESMRAQWSARVLNHNPEKHHPRCEVCYQPKPGLEIWGDETVTEIIGADGEVSIVLQTSDITDRKHMTEELQRRVLHDELTGLANRVLLEDRLQRNLARSGRDGSLVAVLFIDLDRFKVINDTLGHKAGDELLVELAKRLRLVTREQDTIARFGGDEFVMLYEDLGSENDVWMISNRIREQCSAPFQINDRPISVTLSIGIALSYSGVTTETMLRNADLAMYQAKDLGRNKGVLFAREMHEDLVKRIKLENELTQAISDNQFELFYQPVISASDEEITGFEALIRWQHPTHGTLTPDHFLPIAAQLGYLPVIDTWALSTAAHQLREWTNCLPEAAAWTVAVNASAVNFGDLEYIQSVRDILDISGVDPQRITIEVTEDAIMKNAKTSVEIITELRSYGIRIAIDDFGTGYSSLSQLATLDIDVLKIDKSFLADIKHSPSSEIVRAVVEMAHALKIPTIAEGVETTEDLQKLREIGADLAQGFLISKPIPADEAFDLAMTRMQRAI